MAIEVGDAAPDFELKDQHGTPVKLSDFKGEKTVVLVFYPLAFSGICTAERGQLVADRAQLGGDDVQVLAVSIDSVFVHRVFAEKEGYEFPLLSDFWPHGDVAKAYGIFNEDMGAAKRGTYIIDKDGVVQWKVENAIPDARDIDEYRKALADIS
jgi:peroxiredoxin